MNRDLTRPLFALCPAPAAQPHQEGPLAEAPELLPLVQPLPPRQALPAGLHQPAGQAAAPLLQRLHQPDVQRLHRPLLLLARGRRAAAAAPQPGQRSDSPAPTAPSFQPLVEQFQELLRLLAPSFDVRM